MPHGLRIVRRAAAAAAFLAVALATTTAHGQSPVPSPRDVLGYQPGTDSLLADWGQINDYLARLALASPRVRLDTIGRSTLGRPLLLVTLASEVNQRRLPQLRAWQSRLADPRALAPGSEDSLVGAAPVVVLIDNNIHSTEIASSLMQLQLVWRLAADPAWQPMLDSTVVLVIPSPNPDGLDTVVSWYRRYKGTRYEAGPLPWLYHPYAGHDDNRDWYMLTQVETRAITRVLYHEWFPEIVWDVHQMGTTGARLFLPPFSDPVNPNLDPMLVEGISLVGTAMGAEVLDAGRTGVAHQQRFDLWWHGGFRSVPARHNMIGILSEAASARLASPLRIDPDSLRAPETGVNYPAPWLGGWWHVGDIVDYELLAARGLLRLATAERAAFVRRFVTLGRRQVAAGAAGQPFAFLLPPDQWDPGAASTLLNLLLAAGVEVHRAGAPFGADGRTYPAGTFVIPLAQPYRAHVKDLLERQAYPERRQYPGGPLIQPYDVTGWTLGLQMGVTVVTVDEPMAIPGEPVDTVMPTAGRVIGSGAQWVLRNRADAESGLIASALSGGGRAWVASHPLVVQGRSLEAGAVVLDRVSATTGRRITDLAEKAGIEVYRVDGLRVQEGAWHVDGAPRVALYRGWTASMDEGWARWVFDTYGIPYTAVGDSILRLPNFKQRFDILVFPGQSEQQIRTGVGEDRTPPQYAGGLGETGVRNVTDFVANGGTLVTLDASSDFAVSALNLPVRNVLAREGRTSGVSRFSAPGSIFGVVRDPAALPLWSGMPDSTAAFFDDGRAYEVTDGASVVARYAAQPLLSGFVEGPEQVAGKPAVVEARVGRGRVVLIGFRPQHRGQTHAMFKLLFNAVLFGTAR